MGNAISSIGVVPEYSDVGLYLNKPGVGMVVWDADGWQDTTLSWKESCYIHAGISGAEFTIKGPDAQKLLSYASINDVYKWKCGKSKHLVMCFDNGLIMNHALTTRDSEDCFRMFAGNPGPLLRQLQTGSYNAELIPSADFIFQISGPLSLTVIEKATGESMRDVEFLDTRPTKIPGVDADIEVSRIGMTGTLAYELRGPAEAGPEVYDAVYNAGKEYGIKRLGWHEYVVCHVEGGFPQMTCTFMSASVLDPAHMSNPVYAAMTDQKRTGSYEPDNLRARLRSPAEVGWGWMAKFNHDFAGREAVEEEVKNPKRTVVNLLWDPEDIIDIYASLFQKGEAYKLIELPCGQPQPAGGHADKVLSKDGKLIGVSSGTTYSSYYRQMISQCIIDIDQSQIGNNVIVQWGDFGKRIKDVHAKVARFPYLDLPRNEAYDISTVPSGL
ncbi:MAG: aminomethyl transferase family protein [Clostridiales bacterium]|nr:aminomethyl transferase family protein [Clostridiales bacterium]